jgi:glycosyltransferase involved in cell wall biosynthesis
MSAEFPLVSIVTVTKNRAHTLEQTIRSVVEQEYPSIEYIILDGGSSDGTVSIIRKYEGRIARWVSEPDEGATKALNRGFAMTTGEIVAFLNSDDYFTPGIVGEMVKTFREHSEADVVHGDIRYLNLETNEVYACRPFKKNQKEVYRSIYTWPAIYVITFFIRREMLSRAGCMEMVYDTASDFELYMKLLKSGARFHYLDRTVVSHRSGGRSDSSVRGYREIRDISIGNGCSPLLAHWLYMVKFAERKAGPFFTQHDSLLFVRNLYARLFYPNIRILGKIPDSEVTPTS